MKTPKVPIELSNFLSKIWFKPTKDGSALELKAPLTDSSIRVDSNGITLVLGKTDKDAHSLKDLISFVRTVFEAAVESDPEKKKEKLLKLNNEDTRAQVAELPQYLVYLFEGFEAQIAKQEETIPSMLEEQAKLKQKEKPKAEVPVPFHVELKGTREKGGKEMEAPGKTRRGTMLESTPRNKEEPRGPGQGQH